MYTDPADACCNNKEILFGEPEKQFFKNLGQELLSVGRQLLSEFGQATNNQMTTNPSCSNSKVEFPSCVIGTPKFSYVWIFPNFKFPNFTFPNTHFHRVSAIPRNNQSDCKQPITASSAVWWHFVKYCVRLTFKVSYLRQISVAQWLRQKYRQGVVCRILSGVNSNLSQHSVEFVTRIKIKIKNKWLNSSGVKIPFKSLLEHI